MILDEAEQSSLVGKIGTEMKADALCMGVFHPIVELLVVAEIETLPLEFPFQVPVSLRDKEKFRMLVLSGRDHVHPILCFRPRPGTRTPSPFENRVHRQHRHVTANAIALLGNTGYGFTHSLPKAPIKCVQLQDVGPGWKVGISSAGAHPSTHLHVRGGIVLGVLCSAANEILRVLGDPGMIRCHMVRHEVQYQIQASFRELPAGNSKTLRTSQMLIDHVTSYTVGRAHVVFGAKVRKRSQEILKQTIVSIGNCNTSRASFPNSHKPNCIEAISSNGIPFR